MNERAMTPEQNLEARAELFKALGHPVRLLILNLVKMKPRHGEELAAILNLNAATISHHLSKLTAAGLLTSQKDQYYQVYSLDRTMLDKAVSEVVFMPQMGVRAQVQEDAYRNKILRTFFKHGRLTALPAQLKKQAVILERLVEEFEPDRTYTEPEVNQILVDFNDDVAVLRRKMVDYGLMDRENGIYWRIIEDETSTHHKG